MRSNAIDEATGKRLSTRQLLKKVPNVPCLYRHKLNLRYYGIKSVRGKLISESLRTEHGESITDRKIAERRLKVFRLPGSIGERSAKRKTGCGRGPSGCVRATAGGPQTGA